MEDLAVYGTGWLAAGLIVAAIPAPLFNAALMRLGMRPRTGAYRWHYWLGGCGAVVSMIHVVFSITRAQLALAAEIGLWLASAAAALVAVEAVLGAAMRGMGEVELRRSRRRHLAIMPALVVAVGLHALLNGPLPG